MFVWLFICFYLVPMPASTRKYDIEVESMKLYGDDLNSVLARFRRTPAYIEFLKIYLDDMKKERDETAHYLLNIYHRKLMTEIDEMFGVNTTRRVRPNVDERVRLTNLYRRTDEDRNISESEEAAQKLDSYPLLHSILTVEERNSFKDHGFQMAGKLIHALMKSIGPEQESRGSTRQPWGEQDANFTIKTTTEHSHQVTRNSSVITIYANALNTTKKSLRYPGARFRQAIMSKT